MRCIVSGSTFTSASMTIEQPIRMHSEASVTSVNELAQLWIRPVPMLTRSCRTNSLAPTETV